MDVSVYVSVHVSEVGGWLWILWIGILQINCVVIGTTTNTERHTMARFAYDIISFLFFFFLNHRNSQLELFFLTYAQLVLDR